MGQELDQRKTVSVFDFLYVDHHRIGLFLSQFSEFGHLTDVVHSRSVTDDAAVTGGFKGILSGETKSGEREGIERRYSAQWSQALNFLDEVNARKMLNPDITKAHIGGLVLSSGMLSILNMKPLEHSWAAAIENAKDAHQQANAHRGNRQERRSNKNSQAPAGTADVSGLRLLGTLEQPIIMALKSGNFRLWSTLDAKYLLGHSSDLTLKHGIKIAGEWHVLGILDCLPGDPNTGETDGRICGGGNNEFGSGAIQLWRELGLVFGRPDDCHGITPIIIMREVKA
ncbi:hypothetical protein FJ417_02095 [Mesorhizobium sp. B3-1-7]|uniref:hypothetical protein n=1 Tax=Mesorhizobium sp. B3-1-7 TaxID=2589894 RepID=UPI00112B7AA3|nr:hypothetical protein [Mesorhizobium sp. B3-1-7]TPI64447.1 hypothetical protein FJ417_02095 [Mesorhizobium sp. B3-1-7]